LTAFSGTVKGRTERCWAPRTHTGCWEALFNKFGAIKDFTDFDEISFIPRSGNKHDTIDTLVRPLPKPAMIQRIITASDECESPPLRNREGIGDRCVKKIEKKLAEVMTNAAKGRPKAFAERLELYKQHRSYRENPSSAVPDSLVPPGT
jgi:hypothetical protein